VGNRLNWKTISVVVAVLSLAAFAFLVYSGSTISPTRCGVVPCGYALRATANSLTAESYYLYAIAALLVGQVALALIAVTRRPGQTSS
jgi:hypothetical protein